MKHKTICDTKIELPLKKDCRIDNISYAGGNWACLVDYINNVVLFVSPGYYSLHALFSDFKFAAINELPINNNQPFITLPFKEITGVKYSMY